MRIDELDTPTAVVDLDRLGANLTRLQTYLDEHGLANRPHIKTHKIPAIARMQVEAGAVGLTCQKVGEAEVMAAAGFDDLFIPYNLIGQPKLDRLMAVARQATVSVTTDSGVVARGLSAAAERAGPADARLTVLVECDTGAGRCGVQSPAEAAELAQLIEGLPGLLFGGLMTYPNTAQLDDFARATKAHLAGTGLRVERVSGGGTACMWQAHIHPELTEHRAGMYIYGDWHIVQSGAMTLDDVAFGVLATVVSRPTRTRGILDTGSKVLSSDLLGQPGYGHIREYPQAHIEKLSEEHGHVDFSNCDRTPEIGERVTVVPNHCCPVTNLLNEVVGTRNGVVEVVWPVAARGAVR
jgi:D-serine deaminase-like pyridoxal phosphate-dependent protein